MTSADIEFALVIPQRSKFHFRRCVVVPDVSWGMGLHECDLLALTGADIAHEIEIKVSVADLKRDARKDHNHDGGELIRCLWFAGPEDLEAAFLEHAPERAGIILVYENYRTRPGMKYRVLRNAKKNEYARKWTEEERYKLARLGAMRYWSRRYGGTMSWWTCPRKRQSRRASDE